MESIGRICRGAGAHLCRRIDLATAAEDRHSLAGPVGRECERACRCARSGRWARRAEAGTAPGSDGDGTGGGGRGCHRTCTRSSSLARAQSRPAAPSAYTRSVRRGGGVRLRTRVSCAAYDTRAALTRPRHSVCAAHARTHEGAHATCTRRLTRAALGTGPPEMTTCSARSRLRNVECATRQSRAYSRVDLVVLVARADPDLHEQHGPLPYGSKYPQSLALREYPNQRHTRRTTPTDSSAEDRRAQRDSPLTCCCEHVACQTWPLHCMLMPLDSRAAPQL